MNGDVWISVPNWDRFQHYKDRVPPWIKVYLELLDKAEFESISDPAKGLLLLVWLLHARHRGPFSRHKLATCVRDVRTLRHLESLNHAGFVTISASKPLALREEKKNKEKTGSASARTTKEPRSNAGAYQPFEPAETDDHDYVSLEQLQSYAAALGRPEPDR